MMVCIIIMKINLCCGPIPNYHILISVNDLSELQADLEKELDELLANNSFTFRY